MFWGEFIEQLHRESPISAPESASESIIALNMAIMDYEDWQLSHSSSLDF